MSKIKEAYDEFVASLSHDNISDVASEILHLRAENEKLRAALKPFAEQAALYDDGAEDHWEDDRIGKVKVADLRAARAAWRRKMTDDDADRLEPIDIIQLLEELSQDRAPGCSTFATAAIELRCQRSRIAALEAENAKLKAKLMAAVGEMGDAARAAMEGEDD